MTSKEYLRDDALSGHVTITAIIDGEKPIIRTDKTWFYPQGGGQKADRGRIGSCNVLHVAHNETDVDHYVDSLHGLEVGQVCPFEIDCNWRELNRIYHTAGHLIANVVESHMPGVTAISGHQWPGEARVEFEGQVDQPLIQPEKLTEIITDDLRTGLQVLMLGDPFTNRSMQIGSYTAIPCGGTHVHN